MFYILSTFSPTMLGNEGRVRFGRLLAGDARELFHAIKKDGFTSALEHEHMAKFASALLYWQIDANCAEITLVSGDSGLVLILAFRPEEGKVYDYLESVNLANEGKIVFYYFQVE